MEKNPNKSTVMEQMPLKKEANGIDSFKIK